MKLLFTSENFSEEFKELLGFVDSDLSFNNYKADLITASNELYNIIGKEVYKIAVDNESETDEDKDVYQLLWRIKYAIAINAYRLFAPNADLSHTGDGRKMRNEEHEKNAFEWMIENDNKALEKRYYRALDDLITFLDYSKIEVETSESIYSKWIASNNFKKSQELFIRTVSDFDQYFVINSRYLLLTLQPGMKQCQDFEIVSRLGREKYKELTDKMKAATEITDETDMLLIYYIKNAIANFSLAWAIPRLSINIFPDGVVQNYKSDRSTLSASKVPELNQPEWARQTFRDTAITYFKEIENIIYKQKNPIDPTDTNVQPTIYDGGKHFSA